MKGKMPPFMADAESAKMPPAKKEMKRDAKKAGRKSGRKTYR